VSIELALIVFRGLFTGGYVRLLNILFSTVLAIPLVQGGEYKCYKVYSRKKVTIIKTKMRVEKNVLATKTNAAWEISRAGIAELNTKLYSMENLLYYLGTGLIAKENILSDGGGGGGKTFAMREFFESQLRAVKGETQDARNRWNVDLVKFIDEMNRIIDEEKRYIKDADKRLFTIQFHQLLSETSLLGGPNPIKFVKEGIYEVDYSRALIAEKNMFAILDEIEKAPPSLQMTLLSILNERQALAGNKVVQTMLESIAGTTNKTLGQMVSQADPHEIGGRMAYLDRFALKFHLVYTGHSATDNYLFVENLEANSSEKRYTIIDLRGIRPLADNVEISKELISSAVDVVTEMDLAYSQHLKELQSAIEDPAKQPSFYPPYSGSNRANSKVIKMWQAAFIMRQLINGVAYESVNLKMSAKDLVDLAPVVLQGGPDTFQSAHGIKLGFLQYKYIGESEEGLPIPKSEKIVVAKSNVDVTTAAFRNKDIYAENSISTGYYDPSTEMFTYKSLNHGQIRKVHFDVKKGKLNIPNEVIADELGVGLDLDNVFFDGNESLARRLADLNSRLSKIHVNAVRGGKDKNETGFVLSGIIEEYLKPNSQAAIIKEAKEQLAEIKKFHERFRSIINPKIKELSTVSMSEVDVSVDIKQDKEFFDRATKLSSELEDALDQKNSDKVLDIAIQSVRLGFEEMTFWFKNSGSTVAGMFKGISSRRNVMLFGPHGSAKTMMSRMILERELEGISEMQIAKANALLAHVLPHGVKGKGSVWIKQFHPMSTEGDIVGRLDLKAMEEGRGYTYNRTGSLAAKDVFFALLDEFEKAPPGVKTALLSLMNEREVLGGEEKEVSNIISMVITTNSTPSEFLISQGDFSTAAPIFDRIQLKAYVFNKMDKEDLNSFLSRLYAGIMPRLHSPLMLSQIGLLAKYFRIGDSDKMLLHEINVEFLKIVKDRSEAERELHNGQRDLYPTYFMNTHGESRRTLGSTFLKELGITVQMNRVLKGESTQSFKEQYVFDLKDIESFAEMYMTANFAFAVKARYNSDGVLYFVVEKKSTSGIEDRISNREKETLSHMEWEATQMANIINVKLKALMANKERIEIMKQFPKRYRTLFQTEDQRKAWLDKH
jgi:MoxR-like ATPase